MKIKFLVSTYLIFFLYFQMIYQILLDWKRENGTDAQIGLLVKVLWEHCQYDCAERLATANTL